MLIKNKLKIILFFFIFSQYSCSQKEKKVNIEKIDNKKIIQLSKQLAGREYDYVYKRANDSLNIWIKNNVATYRTEKINEWQIDSLICLNTKKDKCLFALLHRNTFFKDQIADGITYFFGVKIKNQWYFFKGPYLPISRMPNKVHIPLTFNELHTIAMREVYLGYLRKNKKGKWVINEYFFDRIEFQFEKWAYWDKNRNLIDNSKLSKAELEELYIHSIVYDKYK